MCKKALFSGLSPSAGCGFGHYICGRFIALFLNGIDRPRSPSVMRFSGASVHEPISQLDQNVKSSESENGSNES